MLGNLKHHGIKGQKWGVRRFQRKDGSLTPAGKKRYSDDIVFKKGSKYRHVSGRQQIDLDDKETYLYNPKNKHDVNVYEGAFSSYIKVGKGYVDSFIHEYELKEDLVSPSTKKRVDIFVESYRNDPVTYARELNYMKDEVKYLSQYTNLSKANRKIAEYDKYFNYNTSDDDLKEYGYRTLNALAEFGSSGSMAVNKYYNSVKDKGYNALIDDNNKGVYNDAVEPFIALYGNRSLKEIGITKLSSEDISRNIDELRKYNMKKYGHDNVTF